MQEPEMVILTMEIVTNLNIGSIVYADYAFPGAMGRAGRLAIYTIENSNFIRYESFIKEDEIVFRKAAEILEANCATKDNEKGLLIYLSGGMGNRAFINRNMPLGVDGDELVYKENGKEYLILPSSLGVAMHINFQLRPRGSSFLLEN